MSREEKDAKDFILRLMRSKIVPPLDPDPDCGRCGGTGYDRAGRCECNRWRQEGLKSPF